MKKILAAVMAAATFVSAISFSAFAIDFSKDSNPFASGDFPLVAFASAMNTYTEDRTDPEASIYVQIPSAFEDTDLYTVSARTKEGAKYIKKISRVGKLDLSATPIPGTYMTGEHLPSLNGRHDYIKIDVKPDYTDNEYKVRFEFSLKAKAKSDHTGTAKGETVTMYIGNETFTGKDSYVAGQKGEVYKPVKNEDNEIIWSDELRDLARLTFIADSDVAIAYPKLNTKWDNMDYAEYFNDQDAFLFEFVSNPYISSTSRAVLELYNPYYDIDTDEVTVAGEDVIIYQVTEDGFVDVTEQFNYGENDDGDLVFTTKTRKLGTYIFAEHEVSTEDVVAPDDVVTPDSKPVPDTGR